MASEGDLPTSERRSGGGRRAEDRGERFRNLAAGLLALCGALSVIYFLFAALGAVDIGEAAVGSAIAVVLALLWLAGAWQRARSGGGFATRGDRERRGF
jgi:ABC-type transport system involved in cytochrome bd biosynthesis fused ATPase/permease subunit